MRLGLIPLNISKTFSILNFLVYLYEKKEQINAYIPIGVSICYGLFSGFLLIN